MSQLPPSRPRAPRWSLARFSPPARSVSSHTRTAAGSPCWVAGLHSYLDAYGVCMPAVWLQPLAHEEHEGSNITGAMEREQLQSAFLELAVGSRRPRNQLVPPGPQGSLVAR